MLMQPAPAWLTDLFKSGKSGWAVSQDIDGVPSVVSYSVLPGAAAKTLGWQLVVSEDLGEVNQQWINSLLISCAAGLAAADPDRSAEPENYPRPFQNRLPP